MAPRPPIRTLLAGNPHQAVHYAFVLRLGADLLGRGLHLQQQLHPLDGRHRRLGHSRRDPTHQQVLPEGCGVKELLSRLLLQLLFRGVTLHGGTTDVKMGSSRSKRAQERRQKGAENRFSAVVAGKWRLGRREVSAARGQLGAAQARRSASNRLPPPGVGHVTADTWLLTRGSTLATLPAWLSLAWGRVRHPWVLSREDAGRDPGEVFLC